MARYYTENESEEMTRWLKEQISVVSVCDSLGYSPVRIGQNYYTLKEHDSVRLDIRKNCFYWNSRGESGSVIDACMSFGKMNREEAYRYLFELAGSRESVYSEIYGAEHGAATADRSAGSINGVNAGRNSTKNGGKKAERVELPPAAHSYRKVYAYLCKTRRISCGVVTGFIKNKMLYQDEKGNCVFVSRDEAGVPVFACKRGTNTYKRFVADCRGNDYARGFYINNRADTLLVAESVIDVMSIMTMMGECDRDKYDYLALSGTGKQEPVIHILNRNKRMKEVVICLNQDNAGRTAAEEIKQQLSDYEGIKVKIRLPKEEGQDWNDVLRKSRNYED